MLGTDGTLYPCLEINARFNMATYQNRIAERLVGPGRRALATVFDLRPRRPYAFEEVRRTLGGLLLTQAAPDARGVLINNFATLNAAVGAGRQEYGRLYAICIGDSTEDVERMSDSARQLLEGMVDEP
jgi:hypothetical protein